MAQAQHCNSVLRGGDAVVATVVIGWRISSDGKRERDGPDGVGHVTRVVHDTLSSLSLSSLTCRTRKEGNKEKE
ncbi:transcriptional regulator [Sesbania bispinosa]|nr:transcriptional regulator [Sesbania bispinosa]